MRRFPLIALCMGAAASIGCGGSSDDDGINNDPGPDDIRGDGGSGGSVATGGTGGSGATIGTGGSSGIERKEHSCTWRLQGDIESFTLLEGQTGDCSLESGFFCSRGTGGRFGGEEGHPIDGDGYFFLVDILNPNLGDGEEYRFEEIGSLVVQIDWSSNGLPLGCPPDNGRGDVLLPIDPSPSAPINVNWLNEAFDGLGGVQHPYVAVGISLDTPDSCMDVRTDGTEDGVPDCDDLNGFDPRNDRRYQCFNFQKPDYLVDGVPREGATPQPTQTIWDLEIHGIGLQPNEGSTPTVIKDQYYPIGSFEGSCSGFYFNSLNAEQAPAPGSISFEIDWSEAND